MTKDKVGKEVALHMAKCWIKYLNDNYPLKYSKYFLGEKPNEAE